MKMNSWIIIIDERRAGGMLDAARRLGGQVVAAVVGPRVLADTMAELGFDRVLCFETAVGFPPEAYAAQVADAAKVAAPRVVMASEAAAGRVLLGAVAAKLNTALIGAVRAIAFDGERIVASRSSLDGKVVEDIAAEGALAVIFDGEDVQISATRATPVELIPVGDPGLALRIIETTEVGEDSAGILTAARVVGVGMGLGSREALKLIEELADAMHAEIACTLPVCDDMRWFPAHRVVGSSHSSIAPDLYIAVGISGQPQHVSGIRDAKIVVAVNNDPEARIFKNCNYGILGDLKEVVPKLASAFKNIE